MSDTTTALASNASAAAVQAAMEATDHCDPGDVTVTGPAGGPYHVVFAASILAKVDPDPIVEGEVKFVPLLTGSTTAPGKVVVSDPHHSG